MERVQKYGFGVLLALLVLALIPYFVEAFYAFPFADDFCFGWTAKAPGTMLEKVKEQYLYWNGRYTADVLVNLHPLKYDSLGWYKATSVLSIVVMMAAAFSLVNEVLQSFSVAVKAVIAMLFVFAWLLLMPNLTEGVYWYIGQANYLWGNAVVLLQLALLVRSYKTTGLLKAVFIIASLILLVIAAGFNEVAAVVIAFNYLLFALLITKDKVLWLHACIALGASAVVVLSPGNSVRSMQFNHTYGWYNIGFMPVAQTARFIGLWLASIPVIITSIITLAYAKKVMQYLPAVKWYWVLIALIITVYAAFILPYAATGMLGQHRTANYVLPFFLLYWHILVVYMSAHFKWWEKLRFIHPYPTVITLCLSVMFGSMTRNSIYLSRDITTGNMVQYYNQQMQAHKLRLKQANTTYISKPEPDTLTVKDRPPYSHSDSSSVWITKCTDEYYKTIKAPL